MNLYPRPASIPAEAIPFEGVSRLTDYYTDGKFIWTSEGGGEAQTWSSSSSFMNATSREAATRAWQKHLSTMQGGPASDYYDGVPATKLLSVTREDRFRKIVADLFDVLKVPMEDGNAIRLWGDRSGFGYITFDDQSEEDCDFDEGIIDRLSVLNEQYLPEE